MDKIIQAQKNLSYAWNQTYDKIIFYTVDDNFIKNKITT